MHKSQDMTYNPLHACIGPSCEFKTNMTQAHLLHHIKSNIPTKITKSQISLLPARTDFLDQKLYTAFKGQVNDLKPLIFMPNDILEKNEYIKGVSTYQVYIFGILPCGSKTMVILTNIKVYIDIMVPVNTTADAYNKLLKGQLNGADIQFSDIEDVQQYRLKEFQKDKTTYKRVYFNNLQDRKRALMFVAGANKALKASGQPKLETAADDASSYYSKVARELRFATADWNRFSKYTVLDARKFTTNCTYVFKVPVGDYLRLDKQKRKEFTMPAHPLSSCIDRDPTLVVQWDIETHRTIQNGQVPTPLDTDYTIFMICNTYCWHWSDDPMFSVCIVDQATNAREGISLVIETGDELGVLESYIELLGTMAPDIMGAFCGSSFDWPLLREKLKRAGLLTRLKAKLGSLQPGTGNYADTEASVLKWNFKPEYVKIAADSTHELPCVAIFPGLLDTDVLPVFLKLYPRAEVRKSFSLNFFLMKNGLDAKEDMPYKRMFRIYERSIKLTAIKSCHCGMAQSLCGTCGERVRDIDCKPVPGSVGQDTEYSNILHDDLLCTTTDNTTDTTDTTDNTTDNTSDNTGSTSDTSGTTDNTGSTSGTTGDTTDNITSDNTSKCTRELCCYCGKKPRNLRDMGDVAYYCKIDCMRPQQLYVKRSIVPDKRELSTLSFVSLYDSFYRADGMKVRNVIGSYCYKRGIAFSNSRGDTEAHEKDHYPGAWVFPPNRGLHSDGMMDIETIDINGNSVKKRVQCRPITGLDFASLYPSLMMTYNLSPDKVVFTKERADQLAAEGYSIYHIKPFKFERGLKKGLAGNKHLMQEAWTVRHNGIFTPKDTKIVTNYTKTEKLTWTDSGQVVGNPVGNPVGNHSLSYTSAAGPTPTQSATISAAKANSARINRKVEYVPTYGRSALKGECMGIFSFIVKKLFDKRVPIKKQFVELSELKEEMDLRGVTSMTVTVGGVERTYDYKNDVIFNINKVNAKQSGLKLLANTFYGESGNYLSSIYELSVAGGITCAGQENIRKVASLVTGLGYTVHYGDTDSIYVSCPDALYAECDAVYRGEIADITTQFIGIGNVAEPVTDDEIEYKRHRIQSRLKWWTEMVSITMKTMVTVKELVSDYLLADNGTLFLNVAYEEVGYPAVLSGKKKYFMTPHINAINFYPKDLFIKGIDIVKQGQAQVTKNLGSEFMRESLSPENERDMRDLAYDKLRKFYETKQDPLLFALSARYRPEKKNVPVLKFVARMRLTQSVYRLQTEAGVFENTVDGQVVNNNTMTALYEPPDAGDKFQYIVVKKNQQYTLQGSKIEIKKGDQMEFMRVYQASQQTANPMEIDYNWYMKSMIIGLFARFIAYHADFQPPAGRFDCKDKVQYRQMDIYCIDMATNHLSTWCDALTGFDKAENTKRGKDYRAIYNHVDKRLRKDITGRYGGAGYIVYKLTIHCDEALSLTTQIIAQMKQVAAALSVTVTGGYIALNAKRANISTFQLRNEFNGRYSSIGISRTRVLLCDKYEAKVIESLYRVVPSVSDIIHRYEQGVIMLVDNMRKIKMKDSIDITDNELDTINTLPEKSLLVIKEVYALLISLISVYRVRANAINVTSEIEIEQARLINEPVTPKINNRQESIGDAIKAELLPEYTWG